MKRPLAVLALLIAAGFPVACGDSKPAGPGATTTAPPAQRGAAAAAASASASPASAVAAKVEEYSENDFLENDRNRDPFRSFTKNIAATKSVAHNQVTGILGEYAVDELKLSAIVMTSEGPVAMLVDPKRKGWTVKKGDFIGRAETVHTGGQNGADYFLTWRVDRIREEDIVFIREDRANPSVPPATRVVTLHPDPEKDKIRQN